MNFTPACQYCMEWKTMQGILRGDLLEHCRMHRKGRTGKWQDTISIIRYAYDFIVIHKSSDFVLKAKEHIKMVR